VTSEPITRRSSAAEETTPTGVMWCRRDLSEDVLLVRDRSGDFDESGPEHPHAGHLSTVVEHHHNTGDAIAVVSHPD
jgi:hypothetical protein